MKWEYKTVKLGATGWMGGKVDEAKLDRMMNDLAAQGSELGAAFDTDVAGGGTKVDRQVRAWVGSLDAERTWRFDR